MKKYVLKSSKLPILLSCIPVFIILITISLQTFIQWGDTSGLFVCSAACFIILFLVFIHKPSVQLIADDEGLSFPKNQCLIPWNDIKKISVSDHFPFENIPKTAKLASQLGTRPRMNFLSTFITITPKNQKDENDLVIVNLISLTQNTKEIDRILNEFLKEKTK